MRTVKDEEDLRTRREEAEKEKKELKKEFDEYFSRVISAFDTGDDSEVRRLLADPVGARPISIRMFSHLGKRGNTGDIRDFIDLAISLTPEDESVFFLNSLLWRYPDPEFYSAAVREAILARMRKSQLRLNAFFFLDERGKKEIAPILSAEARKLPRRSPNDWHPYRHALAAATLLAREGDSKSLEMIARISKWKLRLEIEDGDGYGDTFEVCGLPLVFAATGDRKMVDLLVDMLRHNNEQTPRSFSTVPPFLSFAHTAAVGLSWVVEGFPKVSEWEDFTPERRQQCIDWLDNNEIKIKNFNINEMIEKTSLKPLF